jgi:hypothetical protein
MLEVRDLLALPIFLVFFDITLEETRSSEQPASLDLSLAPPCSSRCLSRLALSKPSPLPASSHSRVAWSSKLAGKTEVWGLAV